ncbi:MAG: hydantoinase/oxoprolinase family protein [Caldilinea sp.]
MNESILVGVDVGGTFTDFVVWRGTTLTVHKVPTTPHDQSIAIVRGLQELGLIDESGFSGASLAIVHGMTVATNALLERRGARTALLTTAGFADALVIGRQNRPHLYKLHQERPHSLVQDRHRLEIAERLDHTGAVLTPLDEAALPALAEFLRAEAIESLAIVLLFSFRNPAHERRAAALLQEALPELPISLSSDILPEYREFERTATTTINAYVQPLVARYLARLEQTLTTQAGGARPSIHIMQSNGGVIALDQAAQQAARVVLSGPAGGAVGAFAVATQAIRARSPHLPFSLPTGNHVNVITFDMGGTSTDVALCPGHIPTTAESTITDLPLRLPVIDIHTVGAGGGSIAFVDLGGALQVGPRSAGAIPGPACYGRGGDLPTVTDANLVLGRLDTAGFLGGTGDVQLDEAAARRVLQQLGDRLHLSAEEAALGVVRVANATMERALRRVSVERGYDPRDFILLPFGGAGPLHACDLAESLGITLVLCPPSPGVLSAYGMLMADVISEASQALLSDAEPLVHDPTPLKQTINALYSRVMAVLQQTEQADEILLTAAIDMRYKGQSYELTVPLHLPIRAASVTAATDAFHAAHAQRYGYAMPHERVEAVTVRLRIVLPGEKPAQQPSTLASSYNTDAKTLYTKPVWFNTEGPTPTAFYSRDALQPGAQFAGPAVVLQYDTTVVLTPGWSAVVDQLNNLWLWRKTDHEQA